MGQLDHTRRCPYCGSLMVMALRPGGKGSRVLQCLDCERANDPLKSVALEWLKGDLQPPK
jgi:hypothetical protein